MTSFSGSQHYSTAIKSNNTLYEFNSNVLNNYNSQTINSSSTQELNLYLKKMNSVELDSKSDSSKSVGSSSKGDSELDTSLLAQKRKHFFEKKSLQNEFIINSETENKKNSYFNPKPLTKVGTLIANAVQTKN